MDRPIPAEDRDIKIAEFGKKEDQTQYFDSVEQKLQFHKENKNLEKASEFGTELAALIFSETWNRQFAEDAAEDEKRKKLLFCLTVEIVTEEFFSDTILSKTLQNSFFASLQELSPEFYSDLKDSGIFSLYLLEYRNQNDAENGVGIIFSVLNDAHKDPTWVLKGKQLYGVFSKLIIQVAQKKQFVKDLESNGTNSI